MASPQGNEQRIGWHVFFFSCTQPLQRTDDVVFG